MSNGTASGPSGIITRSYKPGSIIYFEGDKSEYVYILKSGKVVLTSIKLDTGEEQKEEVRPGEFFGVKSALGKYPREETAQTVGNTLVLVLTPADFERLVLKNSNVVRKMLRVFSNQLRRIVKMERSVLGETEIVNPDAELFKLGEYYYRQGQYRHAQYAYKRYMEFYPDGEHAALVMKRIRAIDAGEPSPLDLGVNHAPKPGAPAALSMERSDEAGTGKGADLLDFTDSGDEPPPASGGSRTALTDEMDDFLSDDVSLGIDDLGAAGGESPIELNEAADASRLRGSFDEALELYKKIISMNRTSSPDEKKVFEKAHFDAGVCLMKLGRQREALEMFSNILRAMPGSSYVKDAIFQIGAIFESAGQRDKAITYYTKVLNMPPKDKLSGEALNRIKKLQGK